MVVACWLHLSGGGDHEQPAPTFLIHSTFAPCLTMLLLVQCFRGRMLRPWFLRIGHEVNKGREVKTVPWFSFGMRLL